MEAIKFRCSALGHIKAGPREKAGELGQTVKTHLIDCFVSMQYGRREDIEGKYLDKGNQREEDSITLLSRVNKKFYKKNSERLTNDYISGECDIFLGEDIRNAEETLDTKTSWSAHTFFRAKNKPLDDDYEEQGHGYMWLTGAKKHTVAFCLVNGTAMAIMDEKRRAAYRIGGIDYHKDPLYIEKCKQIEINHIFDMSAFKEENPFFEFHNDLSDWHYDIPMEERVHCFTFDRDETAIDRIKKRIITCREWMDKELFKNVKELAA